jgi:hypothetical protein
MGSGRLWLPPMSQRSRIQAWVETQAFIFSFSLFSFLDLFWIERKKNFPPTCSEPLNQRVNLYVLPVFNLFFLILLVWISMALKFKPREGFLPFYQKRETLHTGSNPIKNEVLIFISWSKLSGYQDSKDYKMGRPVLKLTDYITIQTLEKYNLPDFEKLKIELKKLQKKSTSPQNFKVIIDAQPLVPWQFVIVAYDSVRQAGIKNVRLRVDNYLEKK